MDEILLETELWLELEELEQFVTELDVLDCEEVGIVPIILGLLIPLLLPLGQLEF